MEYARLNKEQSDYMKKIMGGDLVQKLERLHGHMIEAGAVVTTIFLHTKTYNQLCRSFYPISRTLNGKKQSKKAPRLTGFVTYFGEVKLKPSKYGVEL